MTVELAWRAESVDEAVRPDDTAAIERCLLDYFDGWFESALLARTGDGWRITSTLWRWADGHGPRAD
jgi:hypothetical protein